MSAPTGAWRSDGRRGFGERYRATYRVAFRLAGDADLAARITRDSLAAADASVLPRAHRMQTVRSCRFAVSAALQTELPPVDPADGAQRQRRLLRGALAELPSQQRTIFALIAIANLPVADVGDVLGLSVGWCNSQFRLAEESVRRWLPRDVVEGPEPAAPTLGALVPPVPRQRSAPGRTAAPAHATGPSRGRRDLLVGIRGGR